MLQHKTFQLSLGLILAACFCTWLLVKNHHIDIQINTNLQKKPDAFMYHATYFQYDQKGYLHSRLETEKTTHFPYQNSALLTQPEYLIYSQNHLPWYVTSKNGSTKDGINKIHLWDNVKLYQPPTATHPSTTIKTSIVDVFPLRSIATTKAQVTIIRPGTTITAQGLHANFKSNVVKLLSHAKGSYEETVANQPTKEDN